MRKGLSAIVAILVLAGVLHGQTPRTISYQGVLTDSLDHVKADGMYNFTFRLYTALSGGSPVWTEVKALQVNRGLFSTSLGDVAVLDLPFNTAYWLGVQVGADPELLPRIPLTASGYSLRAVVADTAQYAKSAPSQGYVDSARVAGSVADDAVSGRKLADGAVTASKISGTGASSGQVLKYNGSAVEWASDNVGGFSLPYSGSASSGKGVAVFNVNNSGQGLAGSFTISDPGNIQYAVSGTGANGGASNGVYGKGFVGVHGEGVQGAGVEGISPWMAVMGQGGHFGVYGWSTQGVGVHGESVDSVGVTGRGLLEGVIGVSSNGAGTGILGISNSGIGVAGSSGSGFGISGVSGSERGVYGQGSPGVWGQSSAFGIYGVSTSATGVYGTCDANIGTGGRGGKAGVFGTSDGGLGVDGESKTGAGVSGTSGNIGVYAHNTNGTPGRDAYLATQSLAADLYGNVSIHGSISKSSGSFKIDHPLDPATKYLYHSFVESPDMKNIYDGVATLDASGQATVTLPAWFEALNKDFRYQLTAIGAPAPGLYIAQKVSGNTFRIAGGAPGMEVSWQVTGVRQDAWANAHRIPVEEEKPAAERGFYEHPELFGQPESRSVVRALHPETQKMADDAQRMAEVQRLNLPKEGARP